MNLVPDLYRYEKQKWDLIERYKDRTLEDIFDGSVKTNPRGSFFEIGDSKDIECPNLDRSKALDEFHSDFQLIRGIGTKTEKRLKEKGLKDLYDLKKEGFNEQFVDEIIEAIESKNVKKLQGKIEKWHNLSHKLNYHLFSLVDLEKVAFFDIETMGLNNCPVFLIGIGYLHGEEFDVKQYLARDLGEENAIIKAFKDKLDDFEYLASFNGRRFDSRFIRDRCRYHDMSLELDLPHFDLLHMSRGRWKDSPNHKLMTLENYLFDESRDNDVPSSLIPNYYKTFLKKDNPGPIIPIIEHNKLDIITLFRMLGEF